MYIAASASRTSSSASPPSAKEMPALARTRISCSSTVNGSASSASTRSALSAATWAPATSSSRIANSSPPKRGGVSTARPLVASRLATSISTASPAAWPRPSLIVLKSSRSRKTIATPACSRRARGVGGRGAAAYQGRGAGTRARVAGALVEQGRVGQPGHRVVERLVLELALERPPLGHVAAVEHDAANALVVEQVRELDLELALGEHALDDGGLAGGHGVEHRGRQQRRDRGVAEHALGRRALVDDRAVGIEHGDEVVRVLDERAQAALAGAPVDLLGQRGALHCELDLDAERVQRAAHARLVDARCGDDDDRLDAAARADRVHNRAAPAEREAQGEAGGLVERDDRVADDGVQRVERRRGQRPGFDAAGGGLAAADDHASVVTGEPP